MPNPDFQVAENDGTILVTGRLDFTTASKALAAVKAQMRASSPNQPSGQPSDQPSDQANGQSDPQIIDLGGVTHCNSAALALLIEWLAEAQRRQQTIRFQNIPDSLRQISTVCQVDSLI